MNSTMNTPKRIRSSNFSKEEELLLVEEITKFKNILECKTTNKISLTEKLVILDYPVDVVMASVDEKECIETEKTVTITESTASPTTSNWSKYVPRKLQEKKHPKLGHQSHKPLSTAKETYYKRKLELLENSYCNEEREHHKKMELLDLEIQIKKKQLAQMP